MKHLGSYRGEPSEKGKKKLEELDAKRNEKLNELKRSFKDRIVADNEHQKERCACGNVITLVDSNVCKSCQVKYSQDNAS